MTSGTTGARKPLPARSAPIWSAIASVLDGYRLRCSSPVFGAPLASTTPGSRCVAGIHTHTPYTCRNRRSANRSLATPFCAHSTGSEPAATLPPTTGPPRTGRQAHSVSSGSASCVLVARIRTSSSRRLTSAGPPTAGMSSVDVPSGVARVRPLARRASRWAPRATRTTSCPLAASRPPMVPPIAPAPMTMYRITPILSGAGATGSAAVRVRGHDGAAGHRQVQVGALGAVLVDERRLEDGARLRVLEGPVLDSGCGGGPADLHGRPAEVVPGVAIDSHPGRGREQLVQPRSARGSAAACAAGGVGAASPGRRPR